MLIFFECKISVSLCIRIKFLYAVIRKVMKIKNFKLIRVFTYI